VPLLLPDGKVYVVYYADSHNLRQPDLKSLVLNIGQPATAPSNALHLISQLDSGRASRNLNIDATRYSVDFRFRSREIAAGSQFSVRLAGTDSDGGPLTLVNWELPRFTPLIPQVFPVSLPTISSCLCRIPLPTIRRIESGRLSTKFNNSKKDKCWINLRPC